MSDNIPTVLPSDNSHSACPNWRHRTWWLRPVVTLPLVLLLLSPFLIRAWHLANVPDIADPFDVEAFLSETVDDKDNAFVDYHAAQALVVPNSHLTFEERNEIDDGWEQTSPPVRAWLDANLPALERWRIGTEKTDAVDGNLRSDTGISLPNSGPARDIAELAWLQGECMQSEGRMVEAWNWYRAVHRFSRHVAQRKDCIGRTLGCSLHGQTAKRIVHWASDPRTNIDDLQLALRQLESDFRLTRPFSELLKVTYVDLPKYFALWDESRCLICCPANWRDDPFVRFCRAQPKVTIRWEKMVIENWLCGWEQPRRLHRRIRIVGGTPVLDLTAPKSGISGIQIQNRAAFTDHPGVTDFAETLDDVDTELARQEMLRLSLACQIWVRHHGTFPKSLHDVVPGILPTLPVDPFDQVGAGFRFVHEGDGVVIYSLGRNEVDDLGGEEALNDWLDIGYRILPPRIREPVSAQK